MVDVSGKRATLRTARAGGLVLMRKETLDLVRRRLLPKGNLFEIARIAGITAAKRTAELIPLCHPLQVHHIDISVAIDQERSAIRIESVVKLEGKTGAEMEALTAVSVAALTVYDMCKAVDKTMAIGDIRLIEKRGGKSDRGV
jgi:cyclic pyranopterin phosphate synthase